MSSQVITFGEIMMRLSPPVGRRLIDTVHFDTDFGGGESNVAASLATLGLPVSFVTRLPQNDLGHASLRYLRKNGVDTKFILQGGERIGVYYLEPGSCQRGSKVLYDRSHSSFATIQRGMFDWDAIFKEASWFHFTGITPAVSASAAEVCLEAVESAKNKGVTISCDLNYRTKLWNWGKPASEVMLDLVSYANVIIGNEEDAEKVFDIRAKETDILSGEVEAEHYQSVCEQLANKFPANRIVALTLRGSHSANHNTWSGVLFDRDTFYIGPSFEVTDIVDRVGGGDAFAAGLIYGIGEYSNLQQALNFAVCASCLKHTILGDTNLVTKQEVEGLMFGNKSGRVAR